MSKIYEKEYLAEIAETFDEVDRRVLLWTNPDPTVSFPAQTVVSNEDLSIYDALEVHLRSYMNRAPVAVYRVPIGISDIEISAVGAEYLGARLITTTTSSVVFGMGIRFATYGSYGTQTQDDGRCVPTEIYGIQFGASAGDGSSGGTMNYPDLLHKPTINGVTLVEGLVTEDLNLGDTAHEEITQAEFNALTPEERDDGTVYFIKDGIMGNVFLDDNTPIGTIAPFGGASDPSYWLICDGRAVSRTDYAALFGVIGTTYGAGDGSTTFNIPDLRGNVAVGASTDYSLGDTGGEETHTLSVSEMPSHSHTVSMKRTSVNNYTGGAGWNPLGGSTYDGDFTTQATGDGLAHNNMQPYVVTNYIIKYASTVSEHQANIDFYYPVGSYYETSNASFDPNVTWGGTWVLENEGQVHVSAGSNYTIGDTGGEAEHTLAANEIPAHKHQYGANIIHGDGTIVAGEAINAGLTNSSTTTIRRRYWDYTENNGGSQPHNNMQPYIVVNRWHRTA